MAKPQLRTSDLDLNNEVAMVQESVLLILNVAKPQHKHGPRALRGPLLQGALQAAADGQAAGAQGRQVAQEVDAERDVGVDRQVGQVGQVRVVAAAAQGDPLSPRCLQCQLPQ